MSGITVTIVSVGICMITANQAGDACSTDDNDNGACSVDRQSMVLCEAGAYQRFLESFLDLAREAMRAPAKQRDAQVRVAIAVLGQIPTRVPAEEGKAAGRAYRQVRSDMSAIAEVITQLKGNGERMAGLCVGTALVFRTAALRFVMSGVMLFVSHPTPHAVVGTLDQGLAWCRDQLAVPTKRAVGQR